MKKSVNIYIPEHVPSMNKGEEAIIRGILQGINDEGIFADVTVFSAAPHIDQERYRDLTVISGVSLHPTGIGIFNKAAELLSSVIKHSLFAVAYRIGGVNSLKIFKGDVWKAYANADLILVGHDGVFSDINLLFAIFVKSLRKKHAIFGMGFSGFRTTIAKKLAHRLMHLFDLIVLREEGTFRYLEAVGVRKDSMHLKPDPAFLLQPASNEEFEKLLHIEGLDKVQSPLIGMIAVQGSKIFDNCLSHITDKKVKYEQHAALFAKLAEKIIDITSCTVVFIPHCIGDTPDRDDRIVARDIKSLVGKEYQDKVLLIENEYNASALKKLIHHLDFLVAERTHALIGACSVGTPFLAVTVNQDTRTHDIIGKTFAMPDLLIDINEPDLDKMIVLFENKWNSRHIIRKHLVERAMVVHAECKAAAKMLADLLWC
jgi:polysaccharide pyruvyl transferase WcaK-like protein